MDRKKFAQAYSRHPEKKYIANSSDAVKKLVEPFEAWAKYFGDELYADMTRSDPNTSSENDPEKAMKAYLHHVRTQRAEIALPEIEQAVLSDTSIPEEERLATMYRFSTAHNFHRMSQVMLASWVEMIWGGNISKADRAFGIDVSMFSLAVSSLRYVKYRQDKSDISHGHAYFDEEDAEVRAYGTGIMAELDTGITLLGISRDDPNIIVVPAPRRFEDSDHQFNVDFIAYDRSTDEVVGIQAKTKVHQDDIDRYDPDRVLLVDAEKDLGGRVWTRTEAGKSTTRPVAWPGMVARDYITSLRLHGNKHAVTQLYNQKFLLGIKAGASQHLAPLYDTQAKPLGLSGAKKAVREKLLPMLGRAAR